MGPVPPRDDAAAGPGDRRWRVIAFALSFDDLVITSFDAGVGGGPLPLYIYSEDPVRRDARDQRGLDDIVAVTAIGVLIAWRLGAFTSNDARARRRGGLAEAAPPLTVVVGQPERTWPVPRARQSARPRPRRAGARGGLSLAPGRRSARGRSAGW